MKTAQITYYGEGPLNLQMRRFKSGKSVKTRLDDILPDERRRYADRFLVVGSDGVIINIGSMVPTEVAKLVIGVNPQVYKVPGFDVCIPPGYALDDSGADPKIVEASVMAAQQTATAVKDPPSDVNLKLVGDEDEPPEAVVDQPEVPAEEVDVTVEISEEGAAVNVEPSGPDLNEEEPEEPKKAAKKKAHRKPAKNRKGRGGKKKAPAKKKATKKSSADDLMEMF